MSSLVIRILLCAFHCSGARMRVKINLTPSLQESNTTVCFHSWPSLSQQQVPVSQLLRAVHTDSHQLADCRPASPSPAGLSPPSADLYAHPPAEPRHLAIHKLHFTKNTGHFPQFSPAESLAKPLVTAFPAGYMNLSTSNQQCQFTYLVRCRHWCQTNTDNYYLKTHSQMQHLNCATQELSPKMLLSHALHSVILCTKPNKTKWRNTNYHNNNS